MDRRNESAAHYEPVGLVDKVKAALAPDEAVLTVDQLALLDQFHTRGILATSELARHMDLAAGMRVLDVGCGLGGPARLLALAHGVDVVGVDLSGAFVETARYLSARCGLRERTTFRVADALDPGIEPQSIDRVMLLHVAMNVADRAALYRAIARVLKPGGKLATYDIVAHAGEPHFPVPWAASAQHSHLLTMSQTREALVDAGFHIELWHDDTAAAAHWFSGMQAAGGGPPAGPSLALVLGKDFPSMAGNLARSMREGRVGVLMAVAAC